MPPPRGYEDWDEETAKKDVQGELQRQRRRIEEMEAACIVGLVNQGAKAHRGTQEHPKTRNADVLQHLAGRVEVRPGPGGGEFKRIGTMRA